MPARAEIELYRTETAHYRDNLATGAPALWVVLRRPDADPPYQLVAVTADPAEGEGFTESGADLVEPVPMPEPMREIVEAFVAEHHVERPFFKRKRDRAIRKRWRGAATGITMTRGQIPDALVAPQT